MYKYKRIVIKISGEALSNDSGFGLNNETISRLIKQIKKLNDDKVDVAIVVGGGNFWRGKQATNMDRTTADHMGMLATVINSLALQDALEQINVPTRVQTALTIQRVAEPYILRKAIRHLEKGRVVIFACGTGNPYFSTDTGAALRAAEIQADVLLLAKNIDGVYTSDPKIDKDAQKYDHINYNEILTRDLKVMDATAVSMCRENKIPIVAFAVKEENSIIDAAMGKNIGTLID